MSIFSITSDYPRFDVRLTHVQTLIPSVLCFKQKHLEAIGRIVLILSLPSKYLKHDDIRRSFNSGRSPVSDIITELVCRPSMFHFSHPLFCIFFHCSTAFVCKMISFCRNRSVLIYTLLKESVK